MAIPLQRIIHSPLITEKSQLLDSQKPNQQRIMFLVSEYANKESVKQALFKIHGVKVVKVNILRTKRKRGKFRNIAVLHSRQKRAIVTLAAGEKMDLVKS